MASLVVIAAENNADLIKAESLLKTTNKPFTRCQLIVDTITKNFPDANFITNHLSVSKIKNVLSESDVIDSKYLEFLENAWNSYKNAKHPEKEFSSPFDQGLVNYVFCKNFDANISNLPYYLQCGFYGNDYCTSIFAHTYETALLSAYNGIIAADHAKKDCVVYCANIFPGHHATKNSYSGYCFINNAAVCASILKKKAKRVAILDLDFHHGDGTQKIFNADKDVLTISIHGDPSENYPFYTGQSSENTTTNFNYPMEKSYYKFLIYELVLSSAMSRIKGFDADYLIVAFGADTYHADPEGGMGIQMDDYDKMAKMIRKNYNGPIIVTQEGGYYMDAVADIVAKFLNGLTK